VAWAQWDLNEVGPSSWVGRHENGEADIKIDIFQNFFAVFLVTIEQVSEAVMKTCRAWALRELNKQLLLLGYHPKEDGWFGTSVAGCGKDMTKAVRRQQVRQNLDKMKDPQANMCSHVSKDEHLVLSRGCLSGEGMEEFVTGEAMEGVNSRKKRKVLLSEFYRFRLLFEIRYTHASAERHDSVRMLRFPHLFVRTLEQVGKFGTRVLCTFRDGGKTNKNGHRVFTGVIPHISTLIPCCALYLYWHCFFCFVF